MRHRSYETILKCEGLDDLLYYKKLAKRIIQDMSMEEFKKVFKTTKMDPFRMLTVPEIIEGIRYEVELNTKDEDE